MAVFQHPAMDLGAKYYSAIGQFIFRYSQLEYQLHEIIWFALGVEYKVGRTLTIGITGRRLCEIAKTILSTDIWISDPLLKKQTNRIVRLLERRNGRRNHLVHGTWQSDDATPSGAALHVMKEMKHRVLPLRMPLSQAEIANDVSRLKAANALAQSVIVKLGGPAPSSLKKYARRVLIEWR